jgi:hypothetical protein
MANAAFYYGLVRVLAEAQRPVWTQMSPATAGENFYEAAQRPDAHLYWPVLRDARGRTRVAPPAADGVEAEPLGRRPSPLAYHLLVITEQRCITGRPVRPGDITVTAIMRTAEPTARRRCGR